MRPSTLQNTQWNNSAHSTGSSKTLDQVLEAELEYLRCRRAKLDPLLLFHDLRNSLIGLALSGGGIRSATTNLGILQALSKMDILPKVDYLCTVSGGGYIGGCLSALLSLKRDWTGGPWSPEQHQMNGPADAKFGTQWSNFPFRDELRDWPISGHSEVKHLRTHGNFLVTRRGFFT